MMKEWTTRKTWALGLVVLAAALLPAAIPASAGAAPNCAGAPGIGDTYYPTYGNGGYDVGRYKLKVAYDPATDRLDGKATVLARSTQRLCSFNFDFVGMDVHRIKVNGDRAGWSRSGQELTVVPRDDLKNGKAFRVTVTYDGVPQEFTIPGFPGVRTGFMATPEGVTVAGQPEVAAGWYPVNDHPLDKASYAFDVTVPKGYEVAANGFLRGMKKKGGKTTWSWRANEPMASYLATIDIGQWDVTERTQAGLPSYDAISSQITDVGLRAEIEDSMSRQGEIVDMLSAAFGPYPFSTVGGIVPNQDDLLFALETQTRPVYSKLFWLDDGKPVDGDFVVVHELAHQWYGDDVAVGRWQDIWLNEGFATYAEWLWEEHLGHATPAETFRATYEAIPADEPFWQVVVADPGIEDLFGDSQYVRGAMTLQALRERVGDDAFFAILRGWAASKSGGNGTTPEFIAFAEQVSGQQLDDLFDTWLFTAGRPDLPAAEAVRARATAPDASWLNELRERLAIGRY
jgi:aminopeptidase N